MKPFVRHIIVKLLCFLTLLYTISCSNYASENYAELEGRGNIYDQSGKLLVTNEKSQNNTIVRKYLYEKTAKHVLGDLKKSKNGELLSGFGIEKSYDHLLNGKKTMRGHDLILSIDLELQLAAEKAFRNRKKGAVVVLEAGTGFILAMASFPRFNPHFNNINRAIEKNYTPASTFKPFSAYAGLKNGSINSQTQHVCHQYPRHLSPRYGCLMKHGTVDLALALKQSCNNFFYETGPMIGMPLIAQTAKEFGFGKTTNLKIANEKQGYITSNYSNPKKVYKFSTGLENIKATALQLALAYDALINEGERYQPQLVRRVKDPNTGEIIENLPKIIKEPPEDQTQLKQIKNALTHVLDLGGSAEILRNEGIFTDLALWLNGSGVQIGGKTGSSKKSAKFVGFTPIKQPEIIVVVITETKRLSSVSAAPVAVSIMKAWYEKLRGKEKYRHLD